MKVPALVAGFALAFVRRRSFHLKRVSDAYLSCRRDYENNESSRLKNKRIQQLSEFLSQPKMAEPGVQPASFLPLFCQQHFMQLIQPPLNIPVHQK
jgi:hypothetical protein